MEFPKLIIDADPVVYRSAFSAQTSTYQYVYETAAGEIKERFFSDGNKARRFFRRYPKLEVLDVEKHVVAEAPSHAREAARTLLNHTLTSAANHWGVFRDDIDVELYMSGPDNFRAKIATIAPYKGTRVSELPVHYQVVRNYLQEGWQAHVVRNWEADDQVAIRCRQLQADGVAFILATIDKDLDQVAGTHYDYRQHVLYEMSEPEARRWFWKQVIAGDAGDNIPGCYRVSYAKAESYLSEWDDESDEQIWENVVGVYASVMEKYPDKYPEGMTPYEAALETARLVFMLEYEGQLWTPPGEEHGDLSEAVCRSD